MAWNPFKTADADETVETADAAETVETSVAAETAVAEDAAETSTPLADAFANAATGEDASAEQAGVDAVEPEHAPHLSREEPRVPAVDEEASEGEVANHTFAGRRPSAEEPKVVPTPTSDLFRESATRSAQTPPAPPVVPVASPDAAPAPAPVSVAEPVVEPTVVTAEQDRLAAERAARREARLAALQPVNEEPVPVAVTPKAPVRKPTDRPGISFVLFVLRCTTAFIVGVHGLNSLLDRPAATAVFANTIVPFPAEAALAVGIAEVAIAFALVFGLLTRLAGLGVLLIGAGALALVFWGPWSIFTSGQSGFLGEHELLLAVVGFVLLFLGAGSWSIDYGIRRRHTKAS